MDGISIIMPVYNSEQYLRDAILSVLNQSYENYELILILNGCEDNSLNICKEFEKKDNRIKVIEIMEIGVSVARNKGIEIAKFQKIMFMDSDDIYNEALLEKMISLKENECNVCFFKSFKGKRIKTIKKRNNIINLNDIDETIGFLHKNDIFNSVWNKIYFKKILNRYNIRFDEKLSVAEDLKFNLNYFDKIKKINLINENLYYYRINEKGLNLKIDINRIKIRKELYNFEKKMFIKSNYRLIFVYPMYLKICLAELKQINNIFETKKEKKNEIKKILNNQERKNELKEIYLNSNFFKKIFIISLNNELFLNIYSYIIKVLKK